MNKTRLHLRATSYNVALIFDQMAKLICECEGKIIERPHETKIISNRNSNDNVTYITPFGGSIGLFIGFVLDEYYYYLEADDNIFFPWKYGKTHIENGKRKAGMELYEFDAPAIVANNAYEVKSLTPEEAELIAGGLIDILEEQKESRIHREVKKIRVENTYDNGYHYENIREPERWINV